VLLVAPGVTAAELTCLAGDLRERDRRVVAGFATHPDWDHGCGTTPSVTSRATARPAAPPCCASCAPGRTGATVRPPACARRSPRTRPLDRYGLVTGLPAGSTTIPWAVPTLRVVEHPAHSPGHAALVVEDRRVLVAGDMLSDVFVPMLDDLGDDNTRSGSTSPGSTCSRTPRSGPTSSSPAARPTTPALARRPSPGGSG